MHICLMGRSDLSARPASVVLARRLTRAGHKVSMVCGDGRRPVEAAEVIGVARRLPTRGGRAGRLLRTAQPRTLVENSFDRRLIAAVRRQEADLLYPAGPTDVALARGAGGMVMTLPHWRSADRSDLAWAGADESRWTTAPAGPGIPFPTPEGWDVPEGATIALAYRRTGTNPGRYLEAALQRSGVDVIPLTELDWTAAARADAVVVVESPLPRLEHRGTNPGIPVLYWVHHGEQHLDANVRLARHYQADAVLMAHSLHLAHRFSVPVHRFPFGIAPELGTDWIPHSDRRYDVALIGSGTESTGGRYRRRADLVATAREVAGEQRVLAGRGYEPHEVADVYRHSRIVINDGGDRHFPITMRVMEATGAGALLLSDPAPGLDSLYQPGRHIVEILEDFPAQLQSLLHDPNTESVARAGYEYGMSHHTYDSRATRLLAIVASTERRPHAPLDVSPFEGVLEADPDVETIAGSAGVLVDHVVDDRPLQEIPEAGVDAAYIDRLDLLEPARTAARLFVYAPAEVLTDGDPVGAGYARLDVRAKPREGYAFGGVSYRMTHDA